MPDGKPPRRNVHELELGGLQQIVEDIQFILWVEEFGDSGPDFWDPDKEWDSGYTEAIAQILETRAYGPRSSRCS